jgi:hypothetical protein
MPSDVFVAFLERKLREHGVQKVVPSKEVIDRHMRGLIEQQLTKELIDEHRDEIAEKAAAHKLPRDREGKVLAIQTKRPELPWDVAGRTGARYQRIGVSRSRLPDPLLTTVESCRHAVTGSAKLDGISAIPRSRPRDAAANQVWGGPGSARSR